MLSSASVRRPDGLASTKQKMCDERTTAEARRRSENFMLLDASCGVCNAGEVASEEFLCVSQFLKSFL